MYTSRTVRGVKPSEVGGELRFCDGSSPAGVPIEIEIQAGGAAWTYYTGAVAAADGSWVTSVSLPYSARLRAVFPGDSRPRMESKAIAVKIVPSLKIATSGRPRRRRALQVTGTMSPPSPRVTVTFERRAGRRWVRVQRKRIAVTGRRLLHDRAPARVRPLPRVGVRRRDHPPPPLPRALNLQLLGLRPSNCGLSRGWRAAIRRASRPRRRPARPPS